MAAAKHERARPIESFEQRDGLLTAPAGYDQRNQEERAKEDEGRRAAAPRNRKAQVPRQGSRFATAQAKTRDRAEGNRGDLPERPRKNDDDSDSGQRDHRPRAIRRERSRHAPDSLRHHGDGHELKPVQESFGEGAGKPRRAVSEGEQDQGGRHGEAEPRRQPAQKAIAAQNPE